MDKESRTNACGKLDIMIGIKQRWCVLSLKNQESKEVSEDTLSCPQSHLTASGKIPCFHEKSFTEKLEIFPSLL